MERFEMMTCNSEQVVNLAVDREKSLNLCRRFETTQIFVRIYISVLSLQSFGRRVNRWHRNRSILPNNSTGILGGESGALEVPLTLGPYLEEPGGMSPEGG